MPPYSSKLLANGQGRLLTRLVKVTDCELGQADQAQKILFCLLAPSVTVRDALSSNKWSEVVTVCSSRHGAIFPVPSRQLTITS